MDKLRSHNRDRLAPVENTLWPTDGIAALGAMAAGVLHSRHHPLADLATGRALRALEGPLMSGLAGQ
jgi:hypothetical protein